MFQQNVLTGPGTATFTSHSFEILIMLGVAFLLGLWLGWVLWSRYRQMAEKMRLEQVSLNATASALRTENDQLKSNMAKLEAEKNDLNGQIALATDEGNTMRSRLQFLEAENLDFSGQLRQLKIELGLQAATEPLPETPVEITNNLAESTPEHIVAETPTPEAAPVIAVPVDAPEDSEMDELEDIPMPVIDTQLREPAAMGTDGGTVLPSLGEDDVVVAGLGLAEETLEQTAPTDTPEAPDTKAAETPDSSPEDEQPEYIVVPGARDDLKIVEGIGPKIEELLFQNGINTYTELARTPVNHLKDILLEAGPRFAMHDPGTWSAQSLLAANGEWENLKAYQEFLNAGKRPK